MDDVAARFTEGLKHHFRELNDPRVENRCDHRLMDIIALVMLGTLAGTERHQWLATFLELPQGIPSHDTFRRVFGLLDPREFAACQKEIAARIREQKGHSVLQVKGNQPTLEADLVGFFEEPLASDFADARHTVHESTETGHGRTETRIVHALSLPKDFVHGEDWRDLKSLVVVTSRREVDGEESWDSRYDITDHPPRAKSLGLAIRRHWGIENSRHRVLDAAFGEDTRRQQDRRGATNLAAVRRLAVSLLRQEKTVKRGAKNKRLECALDTGDLLRVLTQPTI